MTGILQNQIAVVTGGGQGLGKAICHALAAAGAHVAVIDLNEESATTTATEVAEEHNRQTLGLKVDVTDETQVEAAIDKTLEKFGRLDIAIANAGILIAGEISQFPADKWRGSLMLT